MQNKFVETVKATIISVIVALFVILILFSGCKLFLGQYFEKVVLLANKMTVVKNEDVNKEIPVIIEEKQLLSRYPAYGTQYATIQIDKIDVDLPVYFGSSLDILKKGVGHSSGSYFPGEGGSIVYMGHNSVNVFRRFSELEIGDRIKVTTTYGEYTYEIYDMQIISETERDKLPFQREEEILMVYTCYPFNNIGYTTRRYVVYSKLVKNVKGK